MNNLPDGVTDAMIDSLSTPHREPKKPAYARGPQAKLFHMPAYAAMAVEVEKEGCSVDCIGFYCSMHDAHVAIEAFETKRVVTHEEWEKSWEMRRGSPLGIPLPTFKYAIIALHDLDLPKDSAVFALDLRLEDVAKRWLGWGCRYEGEECSGNAEGGSGEDC